MKFKKLLYYIIVDTPVTKEKKGWLWNRTVVDMESTAKQVALHLKLSDNQHVYPIDSHRYVVVEYYDTDYEVWRQGEE